MFIFLYNLCTIAIGDCFWYRDFFFLAISVLEVRPKFYQKLDCNTNPIPPHRENIMINVPSLNVGEALSSTSENFSTWMSLEQEGRTLQGETVIIEN